MAAQPGTGHLDLAGDVGDVGDQRAASGPGPAPRGPTVRRQSPWWFAAAAAAGTGYLWLADPTRPGTHQFLPCPFKLMTGLDCPGCGATRATWALVHGHLRRAIGYNALWCALVPLLVWAWVLDVRRRWPDGGRVPRVGVRHPFTTPWFAWALLTTAAVFAVARNLPWAPLRSLHS